MLKEKRSVLQLFPYAVGDIVYYIDRSDRQTMPATVTGYHKDAAGNYQADITIISTGEKITTGLNSLHR